MLKGYERSAAVGVTVGGVLTAAVIALSLSVTREQRQADEWVGHTRQVLETGLRVGADYQDIPMHSERYAVTRRASEERKALDAARRLDQDLMRLRDLTRDNPEQQRSVDELQSIARDGVEYNARIRRLRDGMAALREIMNERPVKPLDNVRALTQRIVDEEQRLLVVRQARLDRSFRRIRLAFVAACLLALAGLTGSLLLLLDGARRRAQADQELERRTAELKRSNTELERFAYVASHDLKEPLRMVVSYTQLLEHRYHGRLDAQADEFIHFAVDGAKRMHALIEGLLEFSRAGSGGGSAVVDADGALDVALANLEVALAESGGRVERSPLPKVLGSPLELARVFQNLIGNALKFRGGKPVIVTIGAERRGAEWVFRVADNGIGIEQQDMDKIFGLFQRLHTKTKYPGTGLGLAICKKIVESRDGRIWVESAPGAGTTFFFTARAA